MKLGLVAVRKEAAIGLSAYDLDGMDMSDGMEADSRCDSEPSQWHCVRSLPSSGVVADSARRAKSNFPFDLEPVCLPLLPFLPEICILPLVAVVIALVVLFEPVEAITTAAEIGDR